MPVGIKKRAKVSEYSLFALYCSEEYLVDYSLKVFIFFVCILYFCVSLHRFRIYNQ